MQLPLNPQLYVRKSIRVVPCVHSAATKLAFFCLFVFSFLFFFNSQRHFGKLMQQQKEEARSVGIPFSEIVMSHALQLSHILPRQSYSCSGANKSSYLKTVLVLCQQASNLLEEHPSLEGGVWVQDKLPAYCNVKQPQYHTGCSCRLLTLPKPFSQESANGWNAKNGSNSKGQIFSLAIFFLPYNIPPPSLCKTAWVEKAHHITDTNLQKLSCPSK